MIRPATADDLDAVLEVNNAAIPHVNELSRADLEQLIEWNERFVVAEAPNGDGIGAFLLSLPGPGLAYASQNYRWFASRYPAFLYVDRIAVAESARRAGLGHLLYRDLFTYAQGRYPVTCAEVNVRPPNDPSLRFHVGLGFEALGEQETEGGSKRVRLLARDQRPHVLFLCTGNAARSVMAAVMAQDRNDECRFTSAGTHSIEGLPMSGRTRRALEAYGLSRPEHRSHQLTSGDVASADVIVGFADEHVAYVERHHPEGRDRAFVEAEVADPAGGDDDAFHACAMEVDAMVDHLIARLPSLVSAAS